MYEVKRVNPLSLAKIQAAVIGAIYLVILAFFILGSLISSFGSSRYFSLFDFFGPILIMALVTAGAIVGGFVVGLITGFVYNWVAEWVGGIKVDMVLIKEEDN